MFRFQKLKVLETITLRVALLSSILFITLLFYFFPQFIPNANIDASDYNAFSLDNVVIPPTQQDLTQMTTPRRPSVVVPSDDEDIVDDLTLEDLDFHDFELSAPPPPDMADGPRVKFIPYDEAPVPLGGINAIQKMIVYPDIALLAGVEGTVIVQAFIDDKGRVKDTVVLKGIPNSGLDEAAIDAIRKTRFKPAKQRDRAIGVWMSIPVNFKIQ